MKRFTALLFCLALLSGCASQTPTPDVPRNQVAWSEQRDRVEALDAWRLAGKVGLRTPQDAVSANLDWMQTGFDYRILISGPFGAGRSVLESSAQGVTLTTSDGRFEAETAEQLMEDQLGWALPVSALDRWVRGLPAYILPHQTTTDDQGFPTQLRQAGWTINYRDWTWEPELSGGLWLPRRLVMTIDDFRATLVVNEWHPIDTGTDA
ncbi:lipoprotein insertase outer membrane protein LolB [Modicisalibacter luteus]|uniref:Outer-membrane lipoprotein LolB n=1 Tax=Modicisalibacter luteus TaxID=453962 RepID=A0ABV7M0X3_9GAMM|nr:lipoprotein insertase outer membrane protein LolB [Halomonas lutea]GHA91545.1 outer-membrane lipoprotein LolB [Halomonas lutea]